MNRRMFLAGLLGFWKRKRPLTARLMPGHLDAIGGLTALHNANNKLILRGRAGDPAQWVMSSVERFPLSNEELLAAAHRFKPPQSWYDEDHEGLT